jgi:hypothetical protein
MIFFNIFLTKSLYCSIKKILYIYIFIYLFIENKEIYTMPVRLRIIFVYDLN